MIGLLYIVVPAVAGLLGAAVCHAAVLAVCRIFGASRQVRPARARDAASSLVFLVGLVLVATRGSNTIRGVLWLGGGLLLGAMIFWTWVVWVRQVHRHAVARFGPRLGTELMADRAE